jgi:hypothetical protein
MGLTFDTGIDMNARAFALDGTSVTPTGWTSKSWGKYNEFRPVNGGHGEVVVEYTHQDVNGTNYGYVLVPSVDFPELSEFLTRYTLLSYDYDTDDWPVGDSVNLPYFDPVTGRSNENYADFTKSNYIPQWLRLPFYGQDGYICGHKELRLPGVNPIIEQKLNNDRILNSIPVYRQWSGVLSRATSGTVTGPDGTLISSRTGTTSADRLIATTGWSASSACVASVYARATLTDLEINVLGNAGVAVSSGWRRLFGSDLPGTTTKNIRSLTTGAGFSWDFATFENALSPSAPCSVRGNTNFGVDMTGGFMYLEFAFALVGGGTGGAYRIDNGAVLLESDGLKLDIGADGNLYRNGVFVAQTGTVPMAFQRFGFVFVDGRLDIYRRNGDFLGSTPCSQPRQMNILSDVNAHLFGVSRAKKPAGWVPA